MRQGWLFGLVALVGLSFAPIFPYRLPCAEPPYDPGFLADVRDVWLDEGFVHISFGGYPLFGFWHALDAYVDSELAMAGWYARKEAVFEVEQHAEGNLSPYIRAAPEDVARLLTLYREIGTDRRCEPTIIGMKGDLPAEAWAELRALPEWPE